MSAQSSRLQDSSHGGAKVVPIHPSGSSHSGSGINYYEPLFRDNVGYYLHAVEDVQNQVQQYQYAVQNSLQVARTLLSSNEALLHFSVSGAHIVADELSFGREEMGSFLLEQLGNHVTLSQQKTDAILDLYNSSVDVSRCVVKLCRSANTCAMIILNYSNLVGELVRADSSSSDMSAFAPNSVVAWERANRANAASQGVLNGVSTLSQGIFETYNLSKQITDRIISLSNTAAQYSGLN